jgi:ClpP class serine protease
VPGTYTVRLVVGDKTLDKKVEVRLDPTVQTPAPDLQQVYDLSIRIRDMQSATNNALRALDSLKGQSEFVERTVRDRAGEVPKELADALSAFRKQLDEQSGKLARPEGGLGFSGRAQLVEKLGNLFFAIEGTNAAPTPAQRAYLEELQAEFRQKLDDANRFITQSVPRVNETLRKHNAPQLIPGKPVEAAPAEATRP